MKLCTLGSGSKGNATLLDFAGTLIMVDCGFGPRELARRLERVGVAPADLDALLITHEHSDHISGAAAQVARFNTSDYMTTGSACGCTAAERVEPHMLRAGVRLKIGAVQVSPVAVPHDAREPVQFVFQVGAVKVGVLTDLGHISAPVYAQYAGCQTLLVEANHDLDMLRSGPYPPFLKRRVAGEQGQHLNNDQAAEFVGHIAATGPLQTLIIAHMSSKNNSSERVADAFARTGVAVPNTVFARQSEPSDWLSLV